MTKAEKSFIKQHMQVKRLALTGLFTAFGVLLPMIFHAFGMGSVMLPMHIPVLFCGLVCGIVYGGICGVLSVLMSTLFTGMPPIYPVAVSMLFELCAYGCFAGLFIKIFKNKNILFLYVCLIFTMLLGRCIAGFVNAFLLRLKDYTFAVFTTANFVKSLPGIITQLILIPVLTRFLYKIGKFQWLKAPPALAENSKTIINADITGNISHEKEIFKETKND